MLVALALRRHLREPSGHVHPEEASLSFRHHSPRRFDVAAVGVSAGGNMVLRQPCSCRPPLGGHELLRRPVAALHLERRYDRALFRGSLLHLRIRQQLGE
jgi:hypothetical protein